MSKIMFIMLHIYIYIYISLSSNYFYNLYIWFSLIFSLFFILIYFFVFKTDREGTGEKLTETYFVLHFVFELENYISHIFIFNRNYFEYYSLVLLRNWKISLKFFFKLIPLIVNKLRKRNILFDSMQIVARINNGFNYEI